MDTVSPASPLTPQARSFRVLRPGLVEYEDALALQDALVAARRAGTAPDTLVLLEHPAVVTLGRAADPANVLLDRRRLAERGIALFETGRGGDVTLHSPGQVVGYPIIALERERRDTHLYLRDIEEVMIRVAADFGVSARRVDGLTGIWTAEGKLGAIGVRLNSGWITSHGFAFNAANDLSLFDVIVPCGIRGRAVTSLARLLGRPVDVGEVMDRFAARFAEVFGYGCADAVSGAAIARGTIPVGDEIMTAAGSWRVASGVGPNIPAPGEAGSNVLGAEDPSACVTRLGASR
jgi:lipoyl(octanoyl) transferase